MSTPARRLFAVFWWLLVIGCVAGSYFWIEHVRNDYGLGQLAEDLAKIPDPFDRVGEAPQSSPDDCLRSAPGPAPAHCASRAPSPALPLLPYVLNGAGGVLAIFLLPFVPLTVIRWIVTGHWRLGPRW